MTHTPRAYGYLRVSTDRQVDSRLGLDAQRRAIEAASARAGLPMAGVYEDAGISGAADIADRPGLMQAVAELKRGDVLIVAKRDRLGRDVVAVALIDRLVERKGGRVLSAAGEGTEGDDPTALLMRRIVDAFSEYERLLIGARTKAALKAKRARGQRAGNVPFGYEVAADGETLIPSFMEQETLAIIRECRRSGLSLAVTADELNRRGRVTRRGTPWLREYVYGVTKAA